MDSLGVSQGLLERVTGHIRAGLVGPLDQAKAVCDRCDVSCSGCIDVHCDQAEKVLAKCYGKVEQSLVDKLGYCYGLLARFGVTFPSIDELIGQTRPAPIPLAPGGEEAPGFEPGEEPKPDEGIGGGIAEIKPVEEALRPAGLPALVVGAPFVPDQEEPAELLPAPKVDNRIPKDELDRILGAGAPVVGLPRGANDARPDFAPGQMQAAGNALFLVQILCRCGGMSVANAVASVSNYLRIGAPIPALPDDQEKEKRRRRGPPPPMDFVAPPWPEEVQS